MSKITDLPEDLRAALERWDGKTSRREFLRRSGLFVMGLQGVRLAGVAPLFAASGSAAAARAQGPYPDVDFRLLDSWLVVREDGTATFFVGKTDGGQGTGTAIRQMMADELDIAYDDTSLVMGRTDITVDQGGSGGSDAIERDGMPARRVAAEARRVLLEMASQRLGVPAGDLTVNEGVVTVRQDASRRVTYAELIGGRRFDVTLTGDNVDGVTGTAEVKRVQDYRIVGQPLPRYDIPAKVDGSQEWAVDAHVPGMVHARNVRPPVVGARLIRVDESSVRNLPGFIQVVTRGNYVAVIAEREEQAIEASRQLQVEWEAPAAPPFPSSEDLFRYLRDATPVTAPEPDLTGDPDGALSAAATVVEAEYDYPFHGHTSIGPAHAMADPSDGQLTIHSNDMKSYGMRVGVATFLGIPRENVRVLWTEGPQLYGRTAADDAGFEAAFLANELGRPVRVQWMRHEETAWDTKGPAFAFTLRGGLDAAGNVVAFDYRARAAGYAHIGYNQPDTVLIAQLMGTRPERPGSSGGGGPEDSYAIPNRRSETGIIRFEQAFETPLRTGNLRDPNGPQIHFASESFIDELAAAAGADPVDFRLRLLRGSSEDDEAFMRARSIAVVEAAARAYGWDARPSPRPNRTGGTLTGRGIAYSSRGSTTVAVIAEVDVDRASGQVWTRRMVCAHDCGLVINPVGLEGTIQGNLLHGLSRALYEEVQFDTEKVTSVDWVTYPTIRHRDAPERIDVVIVNGDPNPDRPDLPPYGAGEPSIRPVAAAVANAIYDATGVRLRRVPFRAERVLEALNAAGV